ncbi:MAG: hypothetical protein ACFE0Q_02870 [Anaerolineae bacterium]
MNLACPQCTKSLNPSHINPALNLVTCDACGATFSAPDVPDHLREEQRRKLAQVVIPERFDIREIDGKLAIRYKKGTRGIISIFFPIVFNGMLWGVMIPRLIEFSSTASPFARNRMGFEQFIPLILIPFVLVGLTLLVNAVTDLVNIVAIEADRQQLRVKHRPIPYPLDKTMNTSEIDQVYVRRKVIKTEKSSYTIYRVHVVSKNRRDIKLLSDLREFEQALFIEYELEKFLGIRDAPVAGEYRG